MILTNARIAHGPRASVQRDLSIEQGRISIGRTSIPGTTILDLRGHLLLPGLINAHDHLEFNLFPKLCRGLYNNAKEWAEDIHRPLDSPVREHLSLSKAARLTWGGLKNLMSGVTTVAHHNEYDGAHFNDAFPVRVLKQFGWAHSLDFSPDVLQRFHGTPGNWPFLIHAAEGIDERARAEIRRLDTLRVLSSHTVLVHAVGLDQPDLDLIGTRNSSIIWCPTSNLSMFGRTLPGYVQRSRVDITIGTDSAITADTDLIAEVATAKRVSHYGAEALYQMVTSRSARLLRLKDGQGSIRCGGVADLIAVADHGQNPAESLADMLPEMVMVGGVIKLISPRLLDRVCNCDLGTLQPIRWEGKGSWYTTADIAPLHQETVHAIGPRYRLAGRLVSC